MDSIDFNNVKAEKAKALRRFNRFRRVGRFFRAAEICVALLFACWTFSRLPFAVQISGEFLRRIAGVISTPLFVFLLGNSIVVVLLTRSSHQKTGAAASAASAETEIYQALVRSVENRSKPSDEDLTEEIVYDDKEVIVTELSSNPNPNLIADENIPHVEIDSDSSSDQLKVYGRSKSDVVSAKQSPDMVSKRALQRSETEKCGKMEDHSNKNYPEDNLSNEEFQKTIEAFIAKQLMFRRQESLAVVVHNNKA
ncbi:unnamed protein product [Microthlaspi erraticum]|uniref:DUF4408 domain-containing protein n=1 Tax=Microthlaspi erraticum TaxID=1685480 RepID=A0A6D2KQR9_9BRAS|nr:unnamed protein product [Microthlaspi erraticum]